MRAWLQRLRQRARRTQPRPLTLMYHRVGTPAVDPWGLAVSPRHFEEQLEVLRRTRIPLTMPDLVSRLRHGTLPSEAVAVTFDDGYADNASEAKPRLVKAGIPATVFLATGFLDRGRAYWWDELAALLLAGTVPLRCELTNGREAWHVEVGRADDEHVARSWRAWQEPTTARQSAYGVAYGRLRAAPAENRERAIERLRTAAGAADQGDDGRPMTTGELAAWSGAPGLDVGAHTVTHPVLPGIDRVECRRELEDSKRACEELLQRSVAGFAYPHGAHDADVRAMVARSGFAWACTTEPRALPSAGADPYALPRIQVPDCDGRSFDRWLRTACVA